MTLRTHYYFTCIILLTAVTGVAVVFLTGQYMDGRHRQDLLNTARLIAESVSDMSASGLTHSADDLKNPYWQAIRDRLVRMQRIDPELAWIYIMKIDQGKIYFLWDTTPEDSPDFAVPGTVYSEAPEELFHVFQSGEGRTAGPYTDQWGTFISAFVPVADRTATLWYVLGMDIHAGRWNQSIRISQIPVALIFVLMLILESLLYVYIRRLRRTESLLRQANTELEQRVEERTQSLRLSREALQDSEERFRAVVEQISDGIILYDLQSHSVLVTNAAYEQMLGYAHDEMQQLTIYDIVAHKRGDIDRYVQSIINDNKRSIKERKHRRKDGRVVDVEVSVNVIRYMEREALCVVVRDITERKRAELKERELERRQSEILKTLPVVIYSAEVLSPYAAVWMSDNVAAITGFPSSQFVAVPGFWEQQTHPDDLAVVKEQLRKLEETDTLDLEYRWLCADGRYHWFSDHLVKGKTVNGKTEYFGVWLDITERKLTEVALKASENKYRNLAEHTSDWVWEIDLNGRFIYSNARAAQLLGYPLESIIGKTLFDFMVPAEAEGLKDQFRHDANNKAATVKIEGTMRRRDGQSVIFEVSGVPVVDEAGVLKGFRGISRDITERRRAEEEKRKLEQQMLHTQKLESLGILAGGIAHDFNNLLMTILGYSELARKKLPVENPAAGHLAEIEKASQRAAELCQQMLAYAGQGRVLIEPLRLNAILKDMLQMLEVSISKKAALKLHLDERLPLIQGDAVQIRQIIMNLVINASDALSEKPGIIAVSTGQRMCDATVLTSVWLKDPLPEGPYVYLEVADTGCGMDEATLDKIFDPFFTTKFAGRGLGLAAVLGIIRGHRGTVQIQSAVGKGTTFTIYFPVHKEDETMLIKEETVPGHSRCQAHILVVDDDPQIRSLTQEILKMLNYTVATASCGHEAIRIFRESGSPFDCVLLDLTMPDMDGQAVYEELCRIDPAVTVILSSGYSAHEIEKRFAGHGIAGFIQKPYNIETLEEKVKTVLHQRKP